MATLNGRLEKKIVEWKLIYEHDDKGVRVLGTRESSGDCLREDGASLRIEISSKEMTRFSTVKHAFVHGDRVYAVFHQTLVHRPLASSAIDCLLAKKTL